MYKIDSDKNIHVTRGNRATIRLKAKNDETFKVDDVIKFSIVERKDYDNVIFQKRFVCSQESSTFDITLTSEDLKIGDIISKPVKYWYEIEYNGVVTPIGYDDIGAKLFVLYPEAPEKEEE